MRSHGDRHAVEHGRFCRRLSTRRDDRRSVHPTLDVDGDYSRDTSRFDARCPHGLRRNLTAMAEFRTYGKATLTDVRGDVHTASFFVSSSAAILSSYTPESEETSIVEVSVFVPV